MPISLLKQLQNKERRLGLLNVLIMEIKSKYKYHYRIRNKYYNKLIHSADKICTEINNLQEKIFKKVK